MAFTEFVEAQELHPIDMVETLAETRQWEFDRVADDQIAMVVEGQWRTYSITLAWSGRDETLRLIGTFDLDPPEEALPRLLDVLNRCNDLVWAGAFTYWHEQRLMVWRYGLVLSGGQIAAPEQLERMIATTLQAAERFYPAFQLVCWTGEEPEAAMRMAIEEAYGRA